MFEPTISSTFEQFPEASPVRGVTFGQATHQGRLRDNNEDHHGAAPDLGFFVVADGVGGAPAGAVAARLATAAMLYSLRNGPSEEAISDTPTRLARASTDTHGLRLCAAAHAAHKMICDFAVRNRSEGSATTMAALWATGDHVHVANTGDSRVYRLCGEGLEQLSKDHTPIQEYIDKHGPLSGRRWSLLDNIVTEVLGGKCERLPAVYLASRPVARREVFLLCTDGLTKMVREGDIATILAGASSPQRAADMLVDIANEAGGLDNITVIVVHVER